MLREWYARRLRVEPAAARAGIRAALLVAAFASVLVPQGAWAQISPGPLSRPHQSQSGPTLCTACHQLGSGKAAFKCLNCHVEIAQRLNENRGLHAALVPKGATSKSCVPCHSEHNGEDFNLVQWNPSMQAFDHSKTGYVLEGKHAGLECRRCHIPEHVPEAERRLFKDERLKRSFLGLSRDCLSCHADAHRAQLGRDCQRCHDAAGWKNPARFNHAGTKFPLTGLHAQVACQKCHAPLAGTGKVTQFIGLAFEKCASCHTDPHRGTFAQDCQSCHTTSGWKQVNVVGKFNHATTAFPLLGKHAFTACSQCHRLGDFKKPLAHQHCPDCHAPDPHRGQFRSRADAGECTACHTVDGFKPARFGLPEHAASAYPLEGKHASVTCAKCHIPAGKATLYKIKFALCTDCHADPHGKQFASAPHLNRCESCHSVQAYQPSSFSIPRHQKTRFPLTGGHLAVACAECHQTKSLPPAKEPVPYHFGDLSCSGCHADPHRGQFRERMAKSPAGGSNAGCEACHSTRLWKELSRFDHASTAYPLTGAHRAVPCMQCHRPPNFETSMSNVSFRSAPGTCDGCHADIHGRQFSAAGKPAACAQCHNTAKWRPSIFDHDKRASFPLRGGHQDVACSECHTLKREVEGRSVLSYKPTPRECVACHLIAAQSRIGRGRESAFGFVTNLDMNHRQKLSFP